MKAPESLESKRLLYRRPAMSDAMEILSRYAGDPEVTRYVAFATHRTLRETEAFILWSDSEWRLWPAGPYLIRTREANLLVGSTGLSFETPFRAMTGYVLARDSWGKGYATEALQTMSRLAPEVGVRRLYAVCHVAHDASRRVLEKGGFAEEGILRRYMYFPNLAGDGIADVRCYSSIL